MISLVSALAAGKRRKMKIELCIPSLDGFFCACYRLDQSPEAVVGAGGRQVGRPMACPAVRRWFQRVVRRISAHVDAHCPGLEDTPDLKKLRDLCQTGRRRPVRDGLRVQGSRHGRSTSYFTCEVGRCVPENNWLLHFCVQLWQRRAR